MYKSIFWYSCQVIVIYNNICMRREVTKDSTDRTLQVALDYQSWQTFLQILTGPGVAKEGRLNLEVLGRECDTT